MNIISKWIDKISQYLELQVRTIQLSIVERVAMVLGYFIFALLLLFTGFAILLFFGFFMSQVFTVLANDNRTLGFLFTVLMYLVLFMALYLCRRPIVRYVTNTFIGILTRDDDIDEEEEKPS